MASVDDRVVQMEFDNRSFSTAVTATLSMLDKLKQSLTFSANKNGIDDVQASANKFSLAGVGSGIDSVSAKFSALSITGVAALATIVSKAVDAGLRVAKSFTISPLTDGFNQYQQQINATQTILANTSQTGGTLKTVTDTLNTLNDYANKTIFNFSDMATNLGTFTSAGVKLGPASDAIQGLSNVAAAAGAGTQQAAGAMYQLSQALGRGKLQAQDWNSVVAAGMASSNFKNALLETAKAMGTIKMPKTESIDDWVKAGGSFQDAMADGNITSGVLIQTLQAMTGNMTDAQLASEGYSAAQIKTIQQMAKEAEAAAVNVKTAKQLMDNLSQGVGSAWAQVFKTIIGDLPTATKLFTGLSGVLNHIFVDPVNNLNTLLKAFVALGGVSSVFDGISNTFKAFAAIVNTVKTAFRQIFPPATAEGLNSIATSFDRITKTLTISAKTSAELQRTFAGVFAVFDLGKQVVSGIFSVLVRLFDSFSGGGSAVLGVTSTLGDFLVKVDQTVKKGDILVNFFNRLGDYIVTPVLILKAFTKALETMFDGFKKKDSDAVSESVSTLGNNLEIVASAFGKVGAAISNFVKPLIQEAKPAVDALVNIFSQLGNNIANALSNQDFSGINKILQTGLLAGIFLTIKKFFDSGLSVNLTGGLINSVKGSLSALTGTLQTMQLQLKAKVLEEIAIAVGLLTASVVALSFVNAENLKKALSAMAVGFGELLGSMAILIKLSGTKGIAKIPIMAASMELVAGAVLILAGAVAILGNLKFSTLEQGLTAVGLLIAAMVGASVILSKNSGGMISAGIGITAIAVAMNILAGAVAIFGNMDLVTLGKGIGAVVLALVSIALAMKLMPNGALLALQGAGLVLISLALEMLSGVIATFSLLDYASIGKGIGSIAAVLLVLAAGLKLMPNGASLALQGVGLVLVAGALEAMAGVVKTLSVLDYKALGKGIGSLALILAVLAAAMKVMQSSILGAISLDLVTLALVKLIPVIQSLASMKWSDIAKGIGVMAISLAVLIAAGYAADGAALGLAALALAALGLGAGIALAGEGVGALAKGLGELIKLGGAGYAILIKALGGIISQIPAFAVAVANGLIAILKVIGDNGPAIIAAFGTIIGSLLIAVTENIPKLAVLIETLIQAVVSILLKDVPIVLAAAITLILAIVTGIASQIGPIVAAVATLIINLLNALASHIPDIIAAGANLIIQFLAGIASQIPGIVGVAASIITTFIGAIAGAEVQIIAAGASAIIAVVTGLGQNASRIVSAGATAIINFINGLASNGVKVVDAAGAAVLSFLTGLDAAVKKYEPQIISECAKIGTDIVTGIINGIGDIGTTVFNKIKSGVSGAISNGVGYVSKLVGSPYKIGALLSEGMVKGVDDGNENLSKSMQNGVDKAISDVSRKLGKTTLPELQLNPTITPILDLSNVQAGASKLNDMITPAPIVAQTSFGQASAISAFQQTQTEGVNSGDGSSPTTTITLEQNNYSPKALSPVEIYRNTKTQLSMAKEALSGS